MSLTDMAPINVLRRKEMLVSVKGGAIFQGAGKQTCVNGLIEGKVVPDQHRVNSRG